MTTAARDRLMTTEVRRCLGLTRALLRARTAARLLNGPLAAAPTCTAPGLRPCMHAAAERHCQAADEDVDCGGPGAVPKVPGTLPVHRTQPPAALLLYPRRWWRPNPCPAATTSLPVSSTNPLQAFRLPEEVLKLDDDDADTDYDKEFQCIVWWGDKDLRDSRGERVACAARHCQSAAAAGYKLCAGRPCTASWLAARSPLYTPAPPAPFVCPPASLRSRPGAADAEGAGEVGLPALL